MICNILLVYTKKYIIVDTAKFNVLIINKIIIISKIVINQKSFPVIKAKTR